MRGCRPRTGRHHAVPDVGIARDRERLASPCHGIAGQPRGALLVGNAGPELAHDRERVHSDPFLDEASVPDRMEVVAGRALGADMISAPVVPEPGMHGLVDVADPMAQELERRQLLLIGRLGRAPADFVETANTIGLPRYAKQAVDQQFARWVMLHVQSNPLPICTRPRVLIKGKRT
jgi:Phage major capsid protein E